MLPSLQKSNNGFFVYRKSAIDWWPMRNIYLYWENLSIDWLSNISIYSSLPPPPSSSLSEVRQEYHIDTQLIHTSKTNLKCRTFVGLPVTTLRCINSIKSVEQDCYSALIDKLLVDSLSNKNVLALSACLMSPCSLYILYSTWFLWFCNLSLSRAPSRTKSNVVYNFNSFAILVHNLFKHVEVGLISNACSPVDTVMCGR